jgi:centractin
VNSQEPTIFSPDESLRGLYRLERPIKRGIIQNFTDSKIIFDKLFNDMKITNNKETPIFICQPPFTPKKQKSELCQLLLENYDHPSVFFGTQAVLSLYAFGKQNGLIVESGEGVTQVVPIYNGYKLDHAVERINLGGEDVTNYLKILLRKNGVHIHSQFDSLIFQDIKGRI